MQKIDEEPLVAPSSAAGSGADGGREGRDREEDEEEYHTWGPITNLEDRFEGRNLCREEDIDFDFSGELDELIRGSLASHIQGAHDDEF